MADFLQLIISGTATGAIYALCALGLVLTYKTAGVFNLRELHGQGLDLLEGNAARRLAFRREQSQNTGVP